MDNEILTTEEMNELEVTNLDDVEETSGSGSGKLAIGLGIAAVVAGGLLYKFRGKLEEKQIKKLEK